MTVDIDEIPLASAVDDVSMGVSIGGDSVDLLIEGQWVRAGKEEINAFVATQMKPELTAYEGEMETALSDFARAKTTAFDVHTVDKTIDFDTHVAAKTEAFDTNAAVKQEAVDASAAQAADSAEVAQNWAEQAETVVKNTATRDLDNLTQVGEARFTDLKTVDQTLSTQVTALQTADAQNVKLTGNQTIGGNKTFTGSITANTQITTYGVKNVNASFPNAYADTWQTVGSTGTAYSQLRANNNSGVFAYISIHVTDDGTISTYCPTPPNGSDSTQIATTAWVRDFAPYVTTTYSSGSSWYRIWSDKWCEQGGIILESTSGNVYNTITFLKAFKNTNYTSLMTSISQTYGYPTVDVRSRTAASMYVNRNNSYGFSWYVAGYIA